MWPPDPCDPPGLVRGASDAEGLMLPSETQKKIADAEATAIALEAMYGIKPSSVGRTRNSSDAANPRVVIEQPGAHRDQAGVILPDARVRCGCPAPIGVR